MHILKQTLKSVKEDYLEVVNELSTNDVEVKTVESPEYKKLKEMYTTDSKAKDEEMDRMNKEVKLIKKMLNDRATREELDEKRCPIIN